MVIIYSIELYTCSAMVVSLVHGRPAKLPEHTVVWARGALCLHHTPYCLIQLPSGAAEATLRF